MQECGGYTAGFLLCWEEREGRLELEVASQHITTHIPQADNRQTQTYMYMCIQTDRLIVRMDSRQWIGMPKSQSMQCVCPHP